MNNMFLGPKNYIWFLLQPFLLAHFAKSGNYNKDLLNVNWVFPDIFVQFKNINILKFRKF